MTSAENLIEMFKAAQCPLSADQESCMIGAMAFYDASRKRDVAAHDAERGQEVEKYRRAIATVCEGWTLPADARKILEAALWQ